MERTAEMSDSDKAAVLELLTRCQEQTQEEKYLDRNNLLRVLKAREFKQEAAYQMWLKWYHWRVEYRADEITEDDVREHTVTGKAFYRGVDKMGRPCLIVRFRNHNPEQFTTESSMRYMIYLVESGVKLADELGTGQICVVYDRGGLTPANRDSKLIDLIRTLSGMLQDFYAERLSAVYVLHVNWFYWLMFQVAKPLLNKKTRNKIHIVRNIEGLTEFFEHDQLLTEYGGSDCYVHPYPAR